MNVSFQPFSFLSGHEVLGYASDGWTLDDAPHGCGPRSFRAPVFFSQQFRAAPLVHLGISGFDIGNGDSARVTVAAENVTPMGFEAVVTTWLHSKLWQVDLNWLAIGP